MAGGQEPARRPGADELNPAWVVVHDLATGRVAQALAAELARDIRLISPVDGVANAGAGYWPALEAELGLGVTVHCGGHAGHVLAALRAGSRSIVFTGAYASFDRLEAIARRSGAELLPVPAHGFDPQRVASGALFDLRLYERLLRRFLTRGVRARGMVPTQAVSKDAWPRRTEQAPMRLTPKVKEILSWYEGENAGVKGNLARLLMHGRLGGTGKLVILPVDQGFEHGPARSFAPNPPAYDPHYLFDLALEAGLSGYAAPLGMLEAGADSFAGELPLILKLNSANSLHDGVGDQAITASVADALRLGCAGVGFTIYPGSEANYGMLEELREITYEAKSKGLAVVVWSYPRGGKVSKEGETAIDVVAYAAHMAALMGANIIKVKPPTEVIDLKDAKKVYEETGIDTSSLARRVDHVMHCAFDRKRLVVFSGGDAKDTEGLLNEIRQIRDGGGSGSIVGRNSFRRSRSDALELLDTILRIYLNEA